MQYRCQRSRARAAEPRRQVSLISSQGSSHYSDVTMGPIASQITSITIVYSAVYPCADQRKHQSSASLAFVRGIHRWPVNSPHKWPVTRKMFPFDDVIMQDGEFMIEVNSCLFKITVSVYQILHFSNSSDFTCLTPYISQFVLVVFRKKCVIW